MKKNITIALVLSGIITYAQQGNVGINTDVPKATLEINVASSNTQNDTNQGILPPKLTKSRVAAIADTNLVKGTLVFVEGTSYTGNNSKVSQITSDGFYHYDGTNWVKVVNAPYLESNSIKIGNMNQIQRAALIGDVLSEQNSNTTTVTKIQGRNVANASPTSGQSLKWNGSSWTPANDEFMCYNCSSGFQYDISPEYSYILPEGTIDTSDNGQTYEYKGKFTILLARENFESISQGTTYNVDEPTRNKIKQINQKLNNQGYKFIVEQWVTIQGDGNNLIDPILYGLQDVDWYRNFSLMHQGLKLNTKGTGMGTKGYYGYFIVNNTKYYCVALINTAWVKKI